MDSKSTSNPFWVWSTIPCKRGMWCQGVSVGTFFCCNYLNYVEDARIFCLKNVDRSLHGMPNLDQVHALIQHYGPTLFFHPDESYLSSSVQWFFNNGTLLYRDGSEKGEPIEFGGMIPTSVTTAVICVGGVRSYNGLRISRLAEGDRDRESCGQTIGNCGKISPRNQAKYSPAYPMR